MSRFSAIAVVTCLTLSAGIWTPRRQGEDQITARSVVIVDESGRARIVLEASSSGAAIRMLDPSGIDRVRLSCAPLGDGSETDESDSLASIVGIHMNRADGTKSISITHEDSTQHGDKQQISMAYGGVPDHDRFRISSLWFGLEDGAELVMSSRSGMPVIHATTGHRSIEPSITLRQLEPVAKNIEDDKKVRRWLQIGRGSGMKGYGGVFGLIVGLGSTWAALGLDESLVPIVKLEGDSGTSEIRPGGN